MCVCGGGGSIERALASFQTGSVLRKISSPGLHI